MVCKSHITESKKSPSGYAVKMLVIIAGSPADLLVSADPRSWMHKSVFWNDMSPLAYASRSREYLLDTILSVALAFEGRPTVHNEGNTRRRFARQ